jgi:hypothetical protein
MIKNLNKIHLAGEEEEVVVVVVRRREGGEPVDQACRGELFD